MPFDSKPYAQKRYRSVKGRSMAYIDEGNGKSIVFQHGNPTSSYLWRNVMPYCEGLGRLIACDLIGMGDSDKLEPSGPNRYGYFEQRENLDSLYEELDLGDGIVLVLHDWGSVLGFDWAHRHSDRIRGIVHMEAIVTPLSWDDWPENARGIFKGFRSDAGERLVLEKNSFVDRVLPSSVLRSMGEAEMLEYRRPFAEPGEGRRPTLSWPRQIPIDGSPSEVAKTVETFSTWLASSYIPNLFINAEPGSILTGRQREVCRYWPNQREVSVRGSHFIQEDSPDQIGIAIAEFVKDLK